ncbi:hypothetical protein [Arenibacter latericius]|uniref:hypothetical protein n=1 Tax=Arenibacter latericius TaxID=86104 RepID=UPI000479BB79|nr:hypothetical protein [Arenibacter latericius]
MSLTQKQIRYTDKWLNRWTKIRESKLKYVFTRGILIYALPFSIVMIFFKLYDNRFYFSEGMLIYLLVGFFAVSVFGVLLALYEFNAKDKKYLRLKEKPLL